MKKAALQYTKNLWFKIQNDEMTMIEVIVLGIIIMVLSFLFVAIFGINID